MKKQLFISLILAGTLFSSCIDFDEGFTAPVPEGTIPVNITGDIQQIQTRATAQGFVDGDAVGIYVVNYTDKNQTPGVLRNSGNQVDHVQYTFIEAEQKWQPAQTVYYKNAETNVDIYGYYPYCRPDNVSAYAFEVQKDQSAPAEGSGLNGYEASDFLWGKTENIVPTEGKVRIAYSHRMACASVELVEGNGFIEGEFSLLSKNVITMNTTRKATIDFSSGLVTPVGEAQADGIVMMPCDDGFRAIVVPQVVDAYKPLFAITIGGVTYNFKKAEDFKFTAGKISGFRITVNKKADTGTYDFVLTDVEISEWKEDGESHKGQAKQYYSVHLDEPGTLGRYLKKEKKDPAKIKNLKVSGVIDARDFYFIRDTMDVIQALNLKEVKIEAVDLTDKMDLYHYKVPQRIESSPNEAGGINIYYINAPIYSNHFENEIPCAAFYNKEYLSSFTYPDIVKRINLQAFEGCSILTGALIIPDSVSEIGHHAFKDCSLLTSLSLPMGLVTIGNLAFSGCSALDKLLLPDSVRSIGNSAFSGCSGFTGCLLLPESLSELGGNAFSNCKGFIGNLKIPESVKKIEEATFDGCSGLQGQLVLHNDLQLGGSCFSRCGFTGELILPNNLAEIPINAFRGCQFSSLSEIPEGLLNIEDNAFAECRKLTGILKLPESLISLGVEAFYSCIKLEGVIFPENLSVIREKAFKYCYSMNNITCKAIEPPIVLSGAFDGVGKDNFTVEVPEQSVNRYLADVQWGEFKRISAFRDFSVSRRLVRTLNAGCDRKLVVRALSGQDWSIESKPDWVTVSPTSGTGKVEVTVSVDEMAKGSEDRTGEVVFLLDGKDYRYTVKVEQYDYEYGDGDVLELQKATKGNGVNIVLMGDCYDAYDISEGMYLADLEEAYGYMFDVEPYKTYKDYFNVSVVFGLSDDSGVGTANTIRDAKFGSQYVVSEGVAPDEQTCFEYACKAPINNDISRSLIILVPNTAEYGGFALMWADGTAIAVCPKSMGAYPYDYRGIVQRVAGGYGFGKLASEEIYHNVFLSACECECCDHIENFYKAKKLGWYRNLSLSDNMHDVNWSHLIFHSKYANMVDIYEGGYMHTRGIYRSEPNSCMNNNIPYFSAISRQAIVERIKEYAGEEFSLEEFYEKDVLTMTSPSASTRSYVPTVPMMFSGRQNPPKFMGDKPDFNVN